MTSKYGSNPEKPLTIGDLLRTDGFSGYTRRQIEYALERGGIRPVGRVGIIRIYSVSQLPQILEAIRRTTCRRARGHKSSESPTRGGCTCD